VHVQHGVVHVLHPEHVPLELIVPARATGPVAATL